MKTPERKSIIRRHTDLEVFQRAFAAAMRFFELSKKFPSEEKFSLTDQGRRSSRSVSGNQPPNWVQIATTRPVPAACGRIGAFNSTASW